MTEYCFGYNAGLGNTGVLVYSIPLTPVLLQPFFNHYNTAICTSVKNAKFRIGASDAGEYYAGWLAELRMYNYALDQAALQQLMLRSAAVYQKGK